MLETFKNRPEGFRITEGPHFLKRGAKLLGLGREHKTTYFHDSSLYGNHGTLTDMDPATDWVFDTTLGRWVLDFDGTDDIVSIADNASLSGMAELTVSAWVYPRSFGEKNYGRIVAKNDPTVYVLFCGTADAAESFQGYINGTKATGAAYSCVLNTWQHVVLWYNGATIRIFVNGVQSGADVSKTGAIAATASALCIGNRATTDRTFSGQIADPCIYNRALSASEIQQLADPSNVMLSGLILPPRRKLWPVATSGTYSTTIEMPVFQLTI